MHPSRALGQAEEPGTEEQEGEEQGAEGDEEDVSANMLGDIDEAQWSQVGG